MPSRLATNQLNAIAPALIETEMVTANLNANPSLISLGHFGSVDDVSAVAVMLAMNDFMTGQTISVNGGDVSGCDLERIEREGKTFPT